MFFVVFGTDKPGLAEVRADARPRHRAFLKAPGTHPVKVRIAGPTLAPGGEAMNGTMLVVEADTLEQVQAFLADDPYVRAGLFAELLVRPWRWGIGNPEEVGS
jgi:uncharacterized protein YciI